MVDLNTQIKNLMLDIVANKTAVFAKDKAQYANDAARSKLVELFGTEKPTYNVWQEKKWAAFAILSEVINVTVPTGIVRNSFLDTLAEFKNGAEGDQNEFVINDTSFLFTANVSGNHWNVDRQKLLGKRGFVVPTAWVAIRVYEELERVLKGLITVAEMFQKIQESLDNDINARIFAAWGGADVFLPDDFKESGTFDKETMLSLIERVQTATGTGVRIVGTRQGLSLMELGSEWVSESMKDERNRNGFIRYWDGIETIVLPQAFLRGTYNFAINPRIIRIVPDGYKPIKIFFEGDNRVRDIAAEDSIDMTLDMQVQTKLGVSVVMPMVFGEYTIS